MAQGVGGNNLCFLGQVSALQSKEDDLTQLISSQQQANLTQAAQLSSWQQKNLTLQHQYMYRTAQKTA